MPVTPPLLQFHREKEMNPDLVPSQLLILREIGIDTDLKLTPSSQENIQNSTSVGLSMEYLCQFQRECLEYGIMSSFVWNSLVTQLTVGVGPIGTLILWLKSA